MEAAYKDIEEHLPGETKKSQDELSTNLEEMHKSANLCKIDDDFATAFVAWNKAQEENDDFDFDKEETSTEELVNIFKGILKNGGLRDG